MARYNRTLPVLTEKQIARFWRKVDKNGPIPADATLGPCWTWIGAQNSNGYGIVAIRIQKQRKSPLWLATRISFALSHGEPGE